MTHKEYIQRADVLIEALPFIQKYRGQLVVIKYGGSAMDDEHIMARMLRDIVFLEAVGINPVLIHGGGKAITDRMRKAGLKARFVNGLRVTEAKAMSIVEEVLDTVVNPQIVKMIGEFGGRARGMSGGQVFRAEKLPPMNQGSEQVDLGYVGEVVGLDISAVKDAVEEEIVPVISPIARDLSGQALNVNADVAAGAIAAELKASKLIYLSDVLGLMRNPKEPDSLIPSVNPRMIRHLIEEEVIEGGMIPKVNSAVAALGKGVGKVHLIDGRIPHSLLLEVFTTAGIGTEIVP